MGMVEIVLNGLLKKIDKIADKFEAMFAEFIETNKKILDEQKETNRLLSELLKKNDPE